MTEKAEPTYLYHYTTATGLKGIVESQELWASDIRYLNDWAEFYHGRGAIKREIRKEIVRREEDPETRRIFESISALLDSPNPLADNPIFVCSFSANRNDLSQWRAYCRDGGYAIGFPRGRLEALDAEHGFSLRECKYSIEDSLQIANAAAVTVKILSPQDQQVISAEPAAEMLAFWSACYKHPAFWAEEEWRLIHSSGMPSVKFRTRGNSLIPYITCRLDDPSLWKDARVVVGPSSHESAELRVQSVRLFLQSELKKHGLPAICVDTVDSSGIPYRTEIGG